MLNVRWLTMSLVLIAITAQPASAQARALLVFGYGGRLFPLTNLSTNGDDLSSGASYGGGIGLQLGARTALRASVTISRSNLRGTTLELDDPVFSRRYYGADLMFGAPSSGSLAPYLFFGGGRISVDPAEPGIDTMSKLAARLGTGVNYVPDNSFFVLFVEGNGCIYQFNSFGFDTFQLDVALVGGLAFAVPF